MNINGEPNKPPRIITIVVRERGGFDVHAGERYTRGLCFGEMLEQVIGLAHQRLGKPQYRMDTPEEEQEDKEEMARRRLIRSWKEDAGVEVPW